MTFQKPDSASVDRFWSKVDRTSIGSCWLWTGALRLWRREPWDGKYGAFWYQNRVVRAHIFAFWLIHGPIPEGKVLRHFCRNRHCVNVLFHISPGTQKQNVADIVRAGRFKLFSKPLCKR